MKPTRPNRARVVVFTDLDGTLLDYHTYSSELAEPLVARLNRAGVPVVFCSSKTRAEQEVYRQRLGIDAPFIVEDGGAIFIEPGYFPFAYDYHRLIDGYQVIELGRPYGEIRRILEQMRQKHNLTFTGFGDMDATQIAAVTGLDMESARRARKRDYEETLCLSGTEPEISFILSHIEVAGLRWAKGTRFYGVMGDNDKGMATRALTELFKRKLGGVKTIGVGDSLNDVPMLAEVDFPVLVQKPGGSWQEVELPNLNRVAGIGPEGWVRAIKELVGE